MKRYARLYLQFVRFSVSRAMEFRVDFLFRIVMDLMYYAVNLAFFKIIYLHTGTLAGWTEPQAMLFVAVYLVVDALNMTIFSNNLWLMPTLINDGSLDYYLTRPVSSLFFLSLREFAVNSAINLIMAVGILVWALSQNSGVLSLGNLLMLGLMILNGTLLLYLIAVLFIVPIFWTHSGRSFYDFFHTFSRFMERPDRMFTGGMHFVVTVLVPFALIASVPTRLFLEAFDPRLFFHLIGVTGLFLTAVGLLWRRGLAAYSSASS